MCLIQSQRITVLKQQVNELHGILAVNKPPGISCAGVIDYLKRSIGRESAAVEFSDHFEFEQKLRASGEKINRKKYRIPVHVGHGGTLDVEAGGVLVIGINRGCKLLQKYLDGSKVYLANCRLGVETESFDAEGRITKITDASRVTTAALERAARCFTGDIQQMPPLYSAIRVDGKRLYEYARKGDAIPIQIKPREVHVDSIKLLKYTNAANGQSFGKGVQLPEDFLNYFRSGRYAWCEEAPPFAVGELMHSYVNQPGSPTFQILAQTGGGVYVRSLVRDIGSEVGSAATMISLLRLAQGPLRLGKDTISVEDFPYIDRIRDAMEHTKYVINNQ